MKRLFFALLIALPCFSAESDLFCTGTKYQAIHYAQKVGPLKISELKLIDSSGATPSLVVSLPCPEDSGFLFCGACNSLTHDRVKLYPEALVADVFENEQLVDEMKCIELQ